MTTALGSTPATKVGRCRVPLRDTVILRVHPRDGRYPDYFEIGAREARRLAWALLADLSPDEIEGDVEAAMETVEHVFGAMCCTCNAPKLRPPAGLAGVILERMLHGPITAAEAAGLIFRSTSIASSLIVSLVAKGLAERVSGGLFSEPTVYATTKLGRATATVRAE
ncbi:hypothetical protein [Phenylobacterium ferrooxidans]|uniref:HTH marR-type domain-containing protein n=1 Tax=Phenylobacterium ferrooxidans TaxID=2982689 RepID=A0ABW6CT24_9CAUL